MSGVQVAHKCRSQALDHALEGVQALIITHVSLCSDYNLTTNIDIDFHINSTYAVQCTLCLIKLSCCAVWFQFQDKKIFKAGALMQMLL